MRKGIAILATAAFAMMTSAALANVIDPTVDKPNAKLRADIAKQVSKYTFCLVKTATKCEKKGANSTVECNLSTGLTTIADPKVALKFSDGIAKCDAKMVLTKKGTDYIGIGCPGDCNAGAPGTQQCADIPAFEANVEGTSAITSAKVQLGVLAAGIDAACGVDTGAATTDQVRIDCTTDQAKLLTKYSQGLFKCQAKCENDFKDKKGDGGPTNGPNCRDGDAGADPNFNTCMSKVLSKVTPGLNPSIASIVFPLVRTAVNDATDGLYNRFDPTSAAGASPCGNCGNAIREGAEECDGGDDALCPGVCTTACACP